MATPRVLSSRRSRILLTGAVAAFTVAGGVVPLAGHAEPRPSLAQVRQRVAALGDQASALAEQYDGARLHLRAAQRRYAALKDEVTRRQHALALQRQHLGAFAAAAYRSAGTDPFMTLVTTGSPQTFIDQASSLDAMADQQARVIAATQAAAHEVRTAERNAARTLAAQRALERRVATKRAHIQGLLDRQQRLLDSLEAQQRAAYDAQQAAAAAAAASMRGTYDGPASGRAGVAVRSAYAQLGKPYVWGASGPDSFDCSGLTQYVWGQAGVALSHYTGAQWNEGRHVSAGNLQPGDLVFFYSDLHHVGIYVGDGQFIHAPHTGDVVKVSPLSGYYMAEFQGAVRPGV